MFEAKLTSKGQITIPVEIRRLLNLQTGDQVLFAINEQGVLMDKSKRPLTIAERFADYNIDTHKKEIREQMTEIDTGNDVGKEETE